MSLPPAAPAPSPQHARLSYTAYATNFGFVTAGQLHRPPIRAPTVFQMPNPHYPCVFMERCHYCQKDWRVHMGRYADLIVRPARPFERPKEIFICAKCDEAFESRRL